MNRFSLNFQLPNPAACPSCACVIDDRNLQFWGDVAFCHECRNQLDYDQLHHLAGVVCEHVGRKHLSVHRGLVFFVPVEYLRKPLQPAFLASDELLFPQPSPQPQVNSALQNA